VHDIVVVETADHMRDRVGLADAAPGTCCPGLALRGASHEPGDVDELDRRGTIFSGCTMPASTASLGSGTGTMPMFGSMVQNG